MSEEAIGCVIVLAMYFVFVHHLFKLWKSLNLGGKSTEDRIRDQSKLYDEARHPSHKIIVTVLMLKTAIAPAAIKILIVPAFGLGSLLAASVCAPNIASLNQYVRALLLDFYSFYLQLRGIEPDFSKVQPLNKL